MRTLQNIFITFSLTILLFAGCTVVKEPIFIETKCPRIEVLQSVPEIDGNITNGCVCNEQLTELLQGTSQLRRSETYYIQQIGIYNKKFTRTLTD